MSLLSSTVVGRTLMKPRFNWFLQMEDESTDERSWCNSILRLVPMFFGALKNALWALSLY